MSNVFQRQPKKVEDSARRTIAFADEVAMPLWRFYSRIFLGWALAQQGQCDDGLDEISGGLDEMQKTGTVRLRPLLLGLMAESQSSAGAHALAQETINTALKAVDTTNFVGERSNVDTVFVPQ